MESSLFVNLKAENSWDVPLGWFLGFEMAICHQEEMRECCSKVCSINIYRSQLKKYFHAAIGIIPHPSMLDLEYDGMCAN